MLRLAIVDWMNGGDCVRCRWIPEESSKVPSGTMPARKRLGDEIWPGRSDDAEKTILVEA
jgi:hypothetical protein